MERRRSQRTEIRHPAKLFVPDEIVHDCIVHNLTPLGICIELAFSAHELTDDIDFSFDNFRTIHRCKTIWREGRLVGVAFDTPTRTAGLSDGGRAAKLKVASRPR